MTKKEIVETTELHGHEKTYTPQISYEFLAEGNLLVGNNFLIAQIGFHSPDGADSILNKVTLNQEIEVYYNPLNNIESFAVRDKSELNIGVTGYISLGLSILFFIAYIVSTFPVFDIFF